MPSSALGTFTEAESLYRSSLAGRDSESHPRHLQASVEIQPPGFPYSVTLCCRVRTAPPGLEPGELFRVRVPPGDDELETLRAERLRKALADKCPKLERCKDEGARTVLVLESDDMALSNQLLVRMRLAELLSERSDVPDEICLVETETRSWAVYPMKVGDAVSFGEGPASFSEFDEADLEARTAGS